MTPDLTLKNITTKVREHRVSDFLSNEQIEQVKKSNIKGKKTTKFSHVDAYIAEIMARFGYEAYIAWKNGDITEKNMARYIMAERAREARQRYRLESLILSSVAGANNPDKHGGTPKSLRTATNILKSEKKLAEGN